MLDQRTSDRLNTLEARVEGLMADMAEVLDAVFPIEIVEEIVEEAGDADGI